MKFGDRLRNGATVIAATETHVLAHREVDYEPWITWAVGPEGSTHHGHYFNELGPAAADLALRTARMVRE